MVERERHRKEERPRREEHLSPRKSADQQAPEPERPVTPQEEAGEDLAQLDDPPQAEGDRD